MTVISGQLRVGEAQSSVRAVAARQRGPAYTYYAILIGMGVVGYAAGAAIDHYFNLSQNGLGGPLGLGAGMIVYVIVSRYILLARFRSRLAERGVPMDIPLRFEIADDVLIYSVGAVEQRAGWSAVTELFQNRGYWIFLVQASPWYLPKRFFSGAADERAFLKSALERMSEDAKRRSQAAVQFVEA